jgi:hypothetical protein
MQQPVIFNKEHLNAQRLSMIGQNDILHLRFELLLPKFSLSIVSSVHLIAGFFASFNFKTNTLGLSPASVAVVVAVAVAVAVRVPVPALALVCMIIDRPARRMDESEGFLRQIALKDGPILERD